MLSVSQQAEDLDVLVHPAPGNHVEDVPKAIEVLEDPKSDFQAKVSAADRLGRSEGGEAVVGALIGALHDPYAEVRGAAAFALGLIGRSRCCGPCVGPARAWGRVRPFDAAAREPRVSGSQAAVDRGPRSSAIRSAQARICSKSRKSRIPPRAIERARNPSARPGSILPPKVACPRTRISRRAPRPVGPAGSPAARPTGRGARSGTATPLDGRAWSRIGGGSDRLALPAREVTALPSSSRLRTSRVGTTSTSSPAARSRSATTSAISAVDPISLTLVTSQLG